VRTFAHSNGCAAGDVGELRENRALRKMKLLKNCGC